MNYKRLLELFWEFSEIITDMHALYLDSVVGYELIHKGLEEYQEEIRKLLGNDECATQEFQDTCSIEYKHFSGKDHQLVSMSPVMEQGALRERVVKNGKNVHILGNQIVVTAYSYWEDYLRIEIGKAVGVLPANATNTDETREILNREVVSDFWGDLRHLRNSIVHSHGIANEKMAKCKTIKWFKPGQPILLNYEMMKALFLCMGLYRNELHKMSLPTPVTLKIPINSTLTQN